MMRKPDSWSKKYGDRYRWAYEAYERFVKEVDPSLEGEFQRSSHVTVVVYGATQVGKTTLILDLLGINAEILVHVSEVLRGGQLMGKSSTACPIRYGRSNDNYWYLDDDRQGLTDGAAMARFGEIRRAVEQGSAQSLEVLNVRIPGRFFIESWEGSLSLDLRILDIPGINAINDAEQAQVVRLADKYVATADLILLVGLADSLGFLDPVALKLQALSDWMLQANRFRVVLTYTFSPASFKTWFGQSKPTAEEVRAKIYAEMGTLDYAPPKSVEPTIFPLELGNSLVSLKTDEEYYQAAVALIAEFRRDLLATIRQSASPYGRLASAFKVKGLIDAKSKREETVYRQRLAALEGDLGTAKTALSQADELEHEFINEGRALKLQVRRVRRYQALAKNSHFNKLFDQTLPTCASESVSALKVVANNFEAGIRAQWQEVCDRHAQRQTNGRLSELKPPSTAALNSFYQKMDGYFTDSYWWSSDGFKADRRMLYDATRKVVETYSVAANEEVTKRLEDQRQGLEKQERAYSYRLRTLAREIEQRQLALASVYRNLDELNDTHQAFEARMKYSVEHSKKFEQYIYEAFSAEVKKVRESIKEPTNTVEQVYDMFYLSILLGELDKMLQGNIF